MKHIYIAMVQLPTLANRCATMLTKFPCIHASISFDENLEKLYAFQIKNKDTPLVGGLVEETQAIYFHGKNNIYIKELVFKIPVTDNEYENMKLFVNNIKNDSEYIFNYVSALFMFFIGGVKSYKAYHCIEFISEVLSLTTTIKLPKKNHKMLPQDLYKTLLPFMIQERNLCSNDFDISNDIFLKEIRFSAKLKKSFYSVAEAIYRTLFKKVSKNFDSKKVNYYESDIKKHIH